jgi:hypothetical protein
MVRGRGVNHTARRGQYVAGVTSSVVAALAPLRGLHALILRDAKEVGAPLRVGHDPLRHCQTSRTGLSLPAFEWLLFGIIVAVAAAGLYGLASGAIAL